MDAKLVIRIAEFHPAIVKALTSYDVPAILAEVNALYEANDEKNEVTGKVSSKAGKETISFTMASKVTAKLPANKPAAILARVHWFLHSSREYYTRIESVELPLSVMEWVKADKFQMA